MEAVIIASASNEASIETLTFTVPHFLTDQLNITYSEYILFANQQCGQEIFDGGGVENLPFLGLSL